MNIVLILLLIYQNQSTEHLVPAGFVFNTLAEQEVLHLEGKLALSLSFFFFNLAAVNLEVKQKECMLNPLYFIFL